MRKCITIIDDCVDVLKLMSKWLIDMECDVTIHKNPLEAIEKIIQSPKPDLILCDYVMFDLDGVSVIQQLRDAGVITRYALFTSYNTPDIEKFCKENDIFYIEKGLTKEKAIEVLFYV